jgi:hypothetical protein
LNNADISFGGLSVGVDGIFITWDDINKNDLNSQMNIILDHESQHYFEQGIAGFGPWTATYYGEMGLKWAWYGGDYWETTYNMNSFEIRARVNSGASPYAYPVPVSHWWDNSVDNCNNAFKALSVWMAKPLF